VVVSLTAQSPAQSQVVVRSIAESATAQVPVKPSIVIIAKSTKEVLGDVELLFKLAKEEKRYEKLNSDLLDFFLTGVDRDQPVVVTGRQFKKAGNTEIGLTVSLPMLASYKDPGGKVWTPGFEFWRKSLSDVNVKSRKVLGSPDVFEVTGDAKGFMRYDAVTKYVHLSAEKVDVQAKFDAPDLTLLGTDDLAVRIDNSTQTPADRKQTFDRIRKEALGGLKAKPTENASDFALRKLASEQQFDEFERFYVDSETIRLGLNTDAAQKKTTVRIEMKAIADSLLAKSIELTGKNPAFYGESTLAGSISGLFLNFPLNEMRKKHIEDYLKLARPRAKERIEARKEAEDQKKIDLEIADTIFNVLEGVNGLDAFNGFAQMIPAGPGKYTLVGGARLVDGKKFADGLAKVATREPEKVKLNVQETGANNGVKLHTIHLANKAARYPQLASADALLYIGTSDKAMWYAMGPNALPALKDAIAQAEKSGAKTSNVLLKIDTRLLPIVEILDARLKAVPPAPAAAPVAGSKPRPPKPDGEIRKMALDAFAAGKDTLHISVSHDAQTVKVEFVVEEGILTFFGKVGGKGVKDALGD
jgi:hypothetical protein